nr:GATA transcription factor 11-like [Ipomoea batatas]
MGPNTLCNPCGVRYRTGRLFPEYRPANSPTFVPTLHSSYHRKVVKMRRKGVEEAAMLAYGFEARAPAVAVIPSRRAEEYDLDNNDEHHRADLHLIDEKREATMIRAENYPRQAKAYHD